MKRSTQVARTHSKARQKLVPTNYGFNMYVDSKDLTVSKYISLTGTWQPEYITLIGHIVKPGDFVLNLGSQSGLEALVMGKIIQPNGRLFIFEPYNFSNYLVSKNIEMNGLKDITNIYKVGASDTKAKGQIKVSYQNTGASEIDLTSAGPIISGFDEVEEIQMDLVDALLPPDVKIDFALLDVEKMEVKALRGMRKVIERSPNMIIMTEWKYKENEFRKEAQTREFLNLMIMNGYKIYSYIQTDRQKCEVGNFYDLKNVENILLLEQTNLFFFPKSFEMNSLQGEPNQGQQPKINKNKMDEQSIRKRNVELQELLSSPKKIMQSNKIGSSQQHLFCSMKRSTQVARTHSKARQKLVPTNYGFNMYVDSKDLTVSKYISLTGTWQPEYITLIGHIVKPGDFVLNLGSQSGLEALVMGKIIQPNGRLFIFEPYNFSNYLVSKNIEMNGLKDITNIYKVGASDTKAKGQIKVSYQNTGASEIDLTSAGPIISGFDEVEEIQMDLVDALLPPDVKIDFALLDVEKMEVKALRGMRKVIERSPNMIIMTEWKYKENKDENIDLIIQLLEWLIRRDYKVYYYNSNPFGKKCSLGTFNYFSTLDEILHVSFMQILFIPSSVPLPK